MKVLSASQTVGPYFKIGLDWPDGNRLVTGGAVAGVIALTGRVLDGDGAPVSDAMIEIWQADTHGRYASATRDTGAFTGFGRCGTAQEGAFRFETVKPGATAAGRAPHINVAVFARGLLTHLYTRIYFAEDASLHASDPVLARVPTARRATLIARGAAPSLVFDIHLQGARETVFFAV